MSLKKDGVIVILSSPSGAGKTTLAKKISFLENYTISISHTTRSPRSNETNGKDYFFISKEEFTNLINQNEFLEFAEVFNNYYGSSKKFVFNELQKGTNVIFDIDWQGTSQIINQKLNYKIITFFILPPSRDELFKRLSNRDMKDKLIAKDRMEQFDKDVTKWKNYDFVVINDDLDECYKKILNFIKKKINNEEIEYDKEKISKHIKLLLN